MRVGFRLPLGRIELPKLLQIELRVAFVALQCVLNLLALFDVVTGFLGRLSQVALARRTQLLVVVREHVLGLLLLRRQAVFLGLSNKGTESGRELLGRALAASMLFEQRLVMEHGAWRRHWLLGSTSLRLFFERLADLGHHLFLASPS